MKKKIIIITIISVVLILTFLTSYFFIKQVSKSAYLEATYNKSLVEAKIGNELIFNNSDVTRVGRTEKEVGISSCSQITEGYMCNFILLVYLNEEAGKRYADITSKLGLDPTPSYRDSSGNSVFFASTPQLYDSNGTPVVSNNPNNNYAGLTKEFYLDKKMDIYVDNELVDSLWISTDLKGKIITQITLTGSGSGTTQENAFKSTQENMKKMKFSLTK